MMQVFHRQWLSVTRLVDVQTSTVQQHLHCQINLDQKTQKRIIQWTQKDHKIQISLNLNQHSFPSSDSQQVEAIFRPIQETDRTLRSIRHQITL